MYHRWAGGYDVLPNDRSAQVAADRTTLRQLQEAIGRTPLERRAKAPETPPLTILIDRLVETMVAGIALRWLDILELETVIGEAATEFGGEEPIEPTLREVLDDSKLRLQRLLDALAAQRKVLVLPECTPEG